MGSNFASLHAGLVARKGEAVPAQSHATFSYVDEPNARSAAAAQPATKPVPRIVVTPQAVPAQQKATPAKAARKRRKPAKYRLTFRMNHDQRRRVRIAAAQKDMSLQHIISDALDAFLDGLSACEHNHCTCLERED